VLINSKFFFVFVCLTAIAPHKTAKNIPHNIMEFNENTSNYEARYGMHRGGGWVDPVPRYSHPRPIAEDAEGDDDCAIGGYDEEGSARGLTQKAQDGASVAQFQGQQSQLIPEAIQIRSIYDSLVEKVGLFLKIRFESRNDQYATILKRDCGRLLNDIMLFCGENVNHFGFTLTLNFRNNFEYFNVMKGTKYEMLLSALFLGYFVLYDSRLDDRIVTDSWYNYRPVFFDVFNYLKSGSVFRSCQVREFGTVTITKDFALSYCPAFPKFDENWVRF